MMTYKYLINNLGCAEDGYKALYTEIMGTEYTGDSLMLKESIDWCLSGLIDWKYLNENAKRINQNGVNDKDRERLEVPYKEMLFLRYGLDGECIRDFAHLADYVLTSKCWRNRSCTSNKVQGWVRRGIALLKHPMYKSVLEHGVIIHFINTLCPGIKTGIVDMVTSAFEVTPHEEYPTRHVGYSQPSANDVIMETRHEIYNSTRRYF